MSRIGRDALAIGRVTGWLTRCGRARLGGTFGIAPVLAYLFTFGTVIGGCCPPGQFCGELTVGFSNKTADSIVIFGVDETGHEYHIEDLLPGQSREVGNVNLNDTHCTLFAKLIARTNDGTEIASREEPLCNRETWVIEAASG